MLLKELLVCVQAQKVSNYEVQNLKTLIKQLSMDLIFFDKFGDGWALF